MTTQTAPVTEAPEPQAPVVAEQPVVEQTPPAAPVVAAPEISTSAPVAPAPPAIDPRQEYIVTLERQNREVQARLAQESAAAAIARRQEALLADGLPPERAQAIATEIVQATQQAQVQIQEREAKMGYAFVLAEEHKLSIGDFRALLQYTSPQAMDAAVLKMRSDSQLASEVSRLKAENAALKKGQVPAQTFESGRGAGGPVATPENIDKLYMDWERAHVGSVEKNPYEDNYRRVIRGR